MSYHNNKPVLRNLFKKLHHLNTCLAVKRPCGFIGKEDIRVIYKRSCNGNSLHLSAGKLTRALVDLLA